MSDLTRDDYQRDLQALRGNVIDAWEAMKTAGFSIADDVTPLEMVAHLLKRNQDQKRLEDGLRERLKAAESMADGFAEEAWEQLWQACMVEQDGARIIDNRCLSTYESACCAFERIGWLASINGRLYRVTRGEWGLVKKAEAAAPGDDFVGISKAVLGYVKGLKAEEDSGSASGEAKATHDNCPQDKKDRGGI
jgi:hypothetical protein